jgi:hypothetical protein
MTVGERCWRPPVLGCSMEPIKSLAASKPSISDLLLRRLESARVVEGHGDLRPEHVCLGSTPRIIECLESRAELRLLDPSDKLAFSGDGVRKAFFGFSVPWFVPVSLFCMVVNLRSGIRQNVRGGPANTLRSPAVRRSISTAAPGCS